MECPSRSFIIFPCATERFQAVPGRTAGSIGCATSRDRAKTHPAPQRNATSVGNIQERTDIPVSALSKEGIKKAGSARSPKTCRPGTVSKKHRCSLGKGGKPRPHAWGSNGCANPRNGAKSLPYAMGAENRASRRTIPVCTSIHAERVHCRPCRTERT